MNRHPRRLPEKVVARHVDGSLGHVVLAHEELHRLVDPEDVRRVESEELRGDVVFQDDRDALRRLGGKADPGVRLAEPDEPVVGADLDDRWVREGDVAISL